MKIRCWLVCFAAFLVTGCELSGILNPKGIIADIELDLLVFSTVLMLVIVVPVILLTLWFAWRYRASNKQATYKPNWAHSIKLEVVCWGAPLIIIAILAWITWVYTHALDPYKPIKSDVEPVEIQVVALEWKWLFIYPQHNIATVNFVQFPVDTPINFKITSDAPMNSFMIPQLGSQIYAMEGMQTKLHLIADEVGQYPGMSANYSGYGFSGMRFNAKVSSRDDFDVWIKTVQNSPSVLSLFAYNKLSQPSRSDSVQYFSSVQPHLFKKIIEKFMMPNADRGFVSQAHRREAELTRKLHH